MIRWSMASVWWFETRRPAKCNKNKNAKRDSNVVKWNSKFYATELGFSFLWELIFNVTLCKKRPHDKIWNIYVHILWIAIFIIRYDVTFKIVVVWYIVLNIRLMHVYYLPKTMGNTHTRTILLLSFNVSLSPIILIFSPT